MGVTKPPWGVELLKYCSRCANGNQFSPLARRASEVMTTLTGATG
jgi:hypothetical protein